MPFADKEDIPTWAHAYMQTAISQNLIKGYEDGTIRPNDKVSRAEMVTMLIRALDIPVEETSSISYNDKDSIPVWAMPYVDAATSFGFVQGNEDYNFEPKKAATRSESAIVLYRLMF